MMYLSVILYLIIFKISHRLCFQEFTHEHPKVQAVVSHMAVDFYELIPYLNE